MLRKKVVKRHTSDKSKKTEEVAISEFHCQPYRRHGSPETVFEEKNRENIIMDAEDSKIKVERLEGRLEMLTGEYQLVQKKLEEAEEKIKKYETAAQVAYEEVDHMQTQLQDEQRCLEKAVRVASRLYSRNTELKKMSTREKAKSIKERHQKWREQSAAGRESSTTKTTNDADENSVPIVNEEIISEENKDFVDAEDELEEIVNLDSKSKSDLEKAQEEINRLKQLNDELLKKLQPSGHNENSGESTTAKLQAIINMQDDELKALKSKYEVESEVRRRAETYAAKMYGRNKSFQRKSVLLKSRQSGSFEEKVENTMKDLQKITQELEEQKMKNKHDAQKLEDKENEVSDVKIQLSSLQNENEKLLEKIDELEKEVKASRRSQDTPLPPPPAPAAPPPPPPPPPPVPTMSEKKDPVQSIYDVIAERKLNRNAGNANGKRKLSTASQAPTGYSDAMEEMMNRIRTGAALKKVSNTLPRSAKIAGHVNSSEIERGNSVSSDDSDEEALEDEYNHIYSFVDTRKNQMPKAATIGGYGRIEKTTDKTSLDQNNPPAWAALKPVKDRNKSTGDSSEGAVNFPVNEFVLKKTQLTRDREFQDSVRLPKDINPDLKRLLDKRRKGIKKAQSEQK